VTPACACSASSRRRTSPPFARERGIPTVSKFFGAQVALELVAGGVRPDVVHAHNVLAHVPDLRGFVAGCRRSCTAAG